MIELPLFNLLETGSFSFFFFLSFLLTSFIAVLDTHWLTCCVARETDFSPLSSSSLWFLLGRRSRKSRLKTAGACLARCKNISHCDRITFPFCCCCCSFTHTDNREERRQLVLFCACLSHVIIISLSPSFFSRSMVSGLKRGCELMRGHRAPVPDGG